MPEVDLLRIFNLAGSAVFAVSGALVAGRKHFDLLGVAVLAVVTAVGGGTLRDVLLGHLPVFWIADPSCLFVIVCAAGLTMVYTRFREPPNRALQVADALGLALVAITGAQVAEHDAHPDVILVVMGTMTGVAGGLMRDIIANEVPTIVRKGEIYATAAIAGVSAYVMLQWFGVAREVAAWLGMATVAGLRLAAVFLGLSLPVYRLPP